MPVDAKTKYKAKKTKIVFFDIDDTLRVKKTGYIPESIRAAENEIQQSQQADGPDVSFFSVLKKTETGPDLVV